MNKRKVHCDRCAHGASLSETYRPPMQARVVDGQIRWLAEVTMWTNFRDGGDVRLVRGCDIGSKI